MASKKSNLAIGAFISIALILLFFFLIFFSNTNYFSDKERVVMYFDGSVQGLQIGAPVKLKGVELGEVVDIEVFFLPNEVDIVNVVTADIILKRIHGGDEPTTDNIFDAVIDKGLRAQLNYQSFLTGLLYVELDFYPDTEMRLLKLQSAYREFPTVKTDLQTLINEIGEVDLNAVTANLIQVLGRIDELLASGKVDQLITDFSAAAVSIKHTADSLKNTSDSIAKTSDDVDSLVLGLNKDVDDFKTLFASATESISLVAGNADQKVPVITDEFVQTMQKMRESLDKIYSAAAELEENFSDDSVVMYEIGRSAQEISRTARSIRELSEALEQEPEALLRGKRAAK